MEIKSFLHFVDKDTIIPHGQPGFNRLARVQPIHDLLKFYSLYCLHRDVSVHDAMIKFNGKSKITQYIPLKPIKRGTKLWNLADSVNGYIIDFKVYIGKEGDTIEKNLGMKVVSELTSKLSSGHRVYFDNYFTSLPLLQHLLDRDVYSCGTFRVNRAGIPYVIKQLREGKQ